MDYYALKINEKGNIAVDDTILMKDTVSTAGSYLLDGFRSPFSAEAITRLEDAHYVISGKTHVGEFGLDLLGEFSYYAKYEDTLCGAAASLVKEGSVVAALGVDVNGTPRRAAALAGVDFLKPTYGTVSRYGIISTAASGEQIGVYASTAKGIASILSVIAGHDDKDGTSLPDKTYSYEINQKLAGKKVCIPVELLELADEQTKDKVMKTAKLLKDSGVIVTEIHTDIFKSAQIAWQMLLCAETCNNISRYDGVRFGHRTENYTNIDELYANSRTEGLNFLTKAVILYGSEMLSKERYTNCYEKSLRIRRMVTEVYKKLMSEYDAILCPACGSSSFSKYEITSAFTTVYEQCIFTSLANIIGAPSIACGGIQLMGDHFADGLLLSFADAIEREA